MPLSLNFLFLLVFFISSQSFCTDPLTEFHFKPDYDGSLVQLDELANQVYMVEAYSEQMVFGDDFSPKQWAFKRSCEARLNKKYHFHLLHLKDKYDSSITYLMQSQGIFYENLIYHLNLYQEKQMSINSYKFFVKSIDSIRKSYFYMISNLSKIDEMETSFQTYYQSYCRGGQTDLQEDNQPSFYYSIKEFLKKANLVLSFVLEDIAKNKKISHYLILNLFVYYESFDEFYFHQYDLLKADSSNSFEF